jgi:hypothetical protein
MLLYRGRNARGLFPELSICQFFFAKFKSETIWVSLK